MEFPNIDPVARQIGPIAIRWYALSYIRVYCSLALLHLSHPVFAEGGDAAAA